MTHPADRVPASWALKTAIRHRTKLPVPRAPGSNGIHAASTTTQKSHAAFAENYALLCHHEYSRPCGGTQQRRLLPSSRHTQHPEPIGQGGDRAIPPHPPYEKYWRLSTKKFADDFATVRIAWTPKGVGLPFVETLPCPQSRPSPVRGQTALKSAKLPACRLGRNSLFPRGWSQCLVWRSVHGIRCGSGVSTLGMAD